MPLEFPCPRCQHLLRTADDKAGLSATCPACGESIWVPYAHEIGAAKDQQQPPEPEAEPSSDRYELEDPFADETPAQPRDASADDPFRDETPHAAQHDAGSNAAEAARADNVGADQVPGMRTCEHCGTENDPHARHCRACGGALPPSMPTDLKPDGLQPRDPDLGEIMQSSWRIFTGELGLLVGAMLLSSVIGFAIGLACMIPAGLGAAIAAAVEDDLVPVGFFIGMLLTVPLLLLLSSALQVGYMHLNLNVARGLQAGIGDLFYGFNEGRSLIVPVFVVTLISSVAVFCTCSLGALVVWPLGLIVVHHRANTSDGIHRGFELIQKEFVTIVLVGLIMFGISTAISMLNMCFYVGIFVMVFVYPYFMMLMTVSVLRAERERIAVDRD